MPCGGKAMKIRWIIKGTSGESWVAVAENEYLKVEAEGDSLFEAMERAEEELARKTEEMLRNIYFTKGLQE